MGKLLLLRHGQSAWNKKNIFTGWIDIPLSLEGMQESIVAGKKISNYLIDVIYTSYLARSDMTAFLAMAQTTQIPCVQHSKIDIRYAQGADGHSLVPLYKAEELNERMYGELQGKNKEQMKKEFGVDQVQLWRRSFDVSPPKGESLFATAQRTIPFFHKEIIPRLQKGETVLVVAHGNSLRSIVMDIEKLSKEAVIDLEIATGEVRVYEYLEGIFSRYE
jgi:2,3-bisphosphoglycerate-dependent phosphoglycerate mutase